METSIFEFRKWDTDIRARFDELLSELPVWRGGEKAALSYLLTEYEIHSGTSSDILTILEQWALKAEAHCSTLIKFCSDCSSSGRLHPCYSGLIFVAMVMDRKQIDLSPTLEQQFHDTSSRFGLASAVLVRPTKKRFSLYATSEEGWQAWLRDEVRVANTPIEELIASGGLVRLDESKAFFESEGSPGRTYYGKT